MEYYIFLWKKCGIGYHPVGRTLTTDWSANSFIMAVYENIFFKVKSAFSVQSTTKKIPIDNHYKTPYRPVRSECSSYGAFTGMFVSQSVELEF